MRIVDHLIMIAGLASCMGACHAVAAAQPPPSSANVDQVLDEVEVKGARLRELRAAVITAEDRVIARYNELNRDDDLDIECLKVRPTGTRLSFRYCRTKLQKRAQQDDSWNWISETLTMQLEAGAGSRQPPSLSQTPIRLLERLDDYKKNLATLLQDDPGLRELAKEHGDARRRYEAALPKFNAKRSQ